MASAGAQWLGGGGQGGRLHLLGYILCELEEYPKLCRKNVKMENGT